MALMAVNMGLGLLFYIHTYPYLTLGCRLVLGGFWPKELFCRYSQLRGLAVGVEKRGLGLGGRFKGDSGFRTLARVPLRGM